MAALLKNPRDSFLIAKGYTLSPMTLMKRTKRSTSSLFIFVPELALVIEKRSLVRSEKEVVGKQALTKSKSCKKVITACGNAPGGGAL